MNFFRNLKRKFRRFEKASEFEKRHNDLKAERAELQKAKEVIKERQRKIEEELNKGRRL